MTFDIRSLTKYRTCRQMWQFGQMFPYKESLIERGEQSLGITLLTYAIRYPNFTENDLFRLARQEGLTETQALDLVKVVVEMVNILRRENHPLISQYRNIVIDPTQVAVVADGDKDFRLDFGFVIDEGETLTIYDVRDVRGMPGELTQEFYQLDDLISWRYYFAPKVFPNRAVSAYKVMFMNFRAFKPVVMLKSGRLSTAKNQYISVIQFAEVAGSDPQYKNFIREHAVRMRQKMFQEMPVSNSQSQVYMAIWQLHIIAEETADTGTDIYRSPSPHNCMGCGYRSECVSLVNDL